MQRTINQKSQLPMSILLPVGDDIPTEPSVPKQPRNIEARGFIRNAVGESKP